MVNNNETLRILRMCIRYANSVCEEDPCYSMNRHEYIQLFNYYNEVKKEILRTDINKINDCLNNEKDINQEQKENMKNILKELSKKI